MKEKDYRLIRSDRKTVAIQITPEGEILLRCPRRMPEAVARRFLEEKRGWAEARLARIRTLPREPVLTEAELKALGEKLAPVLKDRLACFGPRIGVTYGRVTVRRQKSRWGSCSAKGNLNFNCLLALCPPEVLDYVVVHELCHRKEMNHSAGFWAEVENILPDYRNRRKWLKDQGPALIRRLPQGKDMN